MFSLIAEPLTGLADNYFIKYLGSMELAALGVATTLLSSVFWVFNFLGIGTQTQVARALGQEEPEAARRATSVAITAALLLGIVLSAFAWSFLDLATHWMGASGQMSEVAEVYLQIRLLGGPGTLVMIACFGALRGLQDMRAPMVIALAANLLNVILDPILIFQFGLGVAGAAWASTVTQWIAAAWALSRVNRRLGISLSIDTHAVSRLMIVGRDMFLRTGLLITFIVLSTRAATIIGADAGAAHQVVRQIWLLTALVLDAYAATAQSLVGYFLGAGHKTTAIKVARISCIWAFISGAALAFGMLLSEQMVSDLFVPVTALGAFSTIWWVAAVAQPLNAISFATDGIHWGAADYGYLRNAMFLATATAASVLVFWADSLEAVWWTTTYWITVRAVLGVLRIWPGIGRAPLRVNAAV